MRDSTPYLTGDFQTGAVTHSGLTEFGAEAMRDGERRLSEFERPRERHGPYRFD
jgi:hypothetical protein